MTRVMMMRRAAAAAWRQHWVECGSMTCRGPQVGAWVQQQGDCSPALLRRRGSQGCSRDLNLWDMHSSRPITVPLHSVVCLQAGWSCPLRCWWWIAGSSSGCRRPLCLS